MLKPSAAVVAFAVTALLGAGTALGATAPAASTGPVSSVGPATATVSGSVNPNGTATSWHVEFGTTTGYGSSTAAASAGSGTSNVAVSGSLTGLKPGTSYHYRIVATSSAGTARGSDGILVTSSAPEAITIGATNVTPASATLNGTVNPSGRTTSWYFEYGTSTSYGTKTAAKDAGAGTSPVAAAAPVTGLTSGRTYHFRLVATSDAGTSRGADKTFLASAPPTVTTNAASGVSDTSATVHASVNPNGQSTTVYFEYGTSTSYGTKTTAKSIGSGRSAASVSAAVTGLAPGVVYHVRVVASNAVGTNAGSDVSFTTTGLPVVRNGAATGVSSNAATLNGTVDPNGHPTSWYFQYGLTPSYGLVSPTRSASSGGARAVSEAIGGLAPGKTYHFRLVATNGIGPSYSADAAFTTAGPALTLAVSSGTVISQHRVTLTGRVASGRADETVAVYAQRYGVGGSFAALTTVLTDAGGTWKLMVRPTVTTTYKGVWNGSTSSTGTVSVRPAVTLRVLPRLRFATRVTAGRSFAGRVVQLQRHLLDGRWLTIARARLNGHSAATFHPTLKRGRSTLRVAISVDQAGRGYLAGFSAWTSVRR